jgi:hypothetical protein
MLYTVVIAVYCEKHMKHINTRCGKNSLLLIGTEGGPYIYRGLQSGKFAT